MESEILTNHVCLRNCENVTISYEDLRIYRANVDEPKETVWDDSDSVGYFPDPEETSTASTSHSETWTDQMVKLLISTYKDNKHKFDSPNFTKKKVWEKISKELNKFGYNESGPKCDEKWRNLKKTYDKVQMEKKKTGNSKVAWKFFDDIQEIFWRDPHFVPVATASTSGVQIKRKFTESENTIVTKTESSPRKNFSPGEKPRGKSFTASEIEERRQKRHEEKMDLKREMLEWFRDNYSKDKKD
ncbi:unnamed protein product [Phaedon cochleariae]|uniref:Myb/SANT-like DNA-binding domain-containing protein n=1 Tax=Phaedon cochleariae TaxID=80249 RepID=A0A9N9SGN4_PHACE|nr:unnamed protein product [Phaedon cochleariae]